MGRYRTGLLLALPFPGLEGYLLIFLHGEEPTGVLYTEPVDAYPEEGLPLPIGVR